MTSLQPLVIINAVALTPFLASRLPSLSDFNKEPMKGIFPALTLPAQASMLTGVQPSEHGVVANGWYRRDLGEVRFWAQANAQMQAEPLYKTARRLAREAGTSFTCANLFWWFAQGIDADWVLTPKPHYGADGSKSFDILSEPPELANSLEAKHGKFPFHTFWGPMAGYPSSRWIADASATVIREKAPTLSLVYLPHLDYDVQRYGSSGADLERLCGELNDCISTLLGAADAIGARVMVVSEYGIADAATPVYLNRALRKAGLLKARKGPFGEMLDAMGSRAFAVCDHQCAHIYVANRDDVADTRASLEDAEGIERLLTGAEREELGINHDRAGEIVAVAKPGYWFAYPYWLDERDAPDFARTVDIHRKPGYDPCEMFFDPRLSFPKLRVMRKLLAKKLGFRALLDVIPLDASLVKGSHGRLSDDPEHGPVCALNSGEALPKGISMLDVKDLALNLMGLT